MARLLRNVPILVLWFWYFGQEKSWGDPVTIFTGAIVIGLSFFYPDCEKNTDHILVHSSHFIGLSHFFCHGWYMDFNPYELALCSRSDAHGAGTGF